MSRTPDSYRNKTKDLLYGSVPSQCKPIAHGNKYESVAIQQLQTEIGFTIEKRGLLLHPGIRYIGASPDGIANSTIIEINAQRSVH